jgi:hypothetical protein
VWCWELLEFVDEVEDRLVYVVEGRSWVHRWDDADMLFGSFECDTHCLLFFGGDSGWSLGWGAAYWALGL